MLHRKGHVQGNINQTYRDPPNKLSGYKSNYGFITKTNFSSCSHTIVFPYFVSIDAGAIAGAKVNDLLKRRSRIANDSACCELTVAVRKHNVIFRRTADGWVFNVQLVLVGYYLPIRPMPEVSLSARVGDHPFFHIIRKIRLLLHFRHDVYFLQPDSRECDVQQAAHSGQLGRCVLKTCPLPRAGQSFESNIISILLILTTQYHLIFPDRKIFSIQHLVYTHKIVFQCPL